MGNGHNLQFLKRLMVIDAISGLSLLNYPQAESDLKNPQLISGMMSALFSFFEEEIGSGDISSINLKNSKFVFTQLFNLKIILEVELFTHPTLVKAFSAYTLEILSNTLPQESSNPNDYMPLLKQLEFDSYYQVSELSDTLGTHHLKNLFSDLEILRLHPSGKISPILTHQTLSTITHNSLNRIKKEIDDLDQLTNHSTYYLRSIQLPQGKQNVLIISLSDEHCEESGERFAVLAPIKYDSLLESNAMLLLTYFERAHHHFSPKFPFQLYSEIFDVEKSTIPLRYTKNEIYGFKFLRAIFSEFLETYLYGEPIYIICDEYGYDAVSNFLVKFNHSFKNQISSYQTESVDSNRLITFISRPLLKEINRKKDFFVVLGDVKEARLEDSTFFDKEIENLSEMPTEDLMHTYETLVDEIIRYVDEVFFTISGLMSRSEAVAELTEITSRLLDLHTLGIVENILDHRYPTYYKLYLELKKDVFKDEQIHNKIHRYPHKIIDAFNLNDHLSYVQRSRLLYILRSASVILFLGFASMLIFNSLNFDV